MIPIMDTQDTVTLYRPVGPKELELLKNSGFRRWPPRLPEQINDNIVGDIELIGEYRKPV